MSLLKKFHISTPVFFLGLASFFGDVASETVYPLLPFFIQTLGGGVIFLGLLEGAAEAIASITKVASGYASDRYKRITPFVLWGYGLSNILRPVLGLSTSISQVFFIRFGDRIGKGIRTAPRDSWLGRLTTPSTRGRVYGFHRGMDHAGAMLAPLLATVFLYYFPGQYRVLFLLTIIPGIIALVCVMKALKHTPAETLAPAASNKVLKFADVKNLPKHFLLFLGVLFLFSLSCSADLFLLLKLKEVGIPEIWIPLLWSALHLVKMLSSLWGGIWSDRVGRRTSILAGWSLYAAIYLSFAFIHDPLLAVAVFLLYGIYFGLTEGVEKALVADLVEPNLLGTSFGLYHLTVGLSLLPASVIFGFLWQRYESTTAFIFSAALACAASILFVFLPLRKSTV